MRGERAIFFLSGWAGLRCLSLFSGLYGTTEVVPFYEPGFRVVSPPILFRKGANKGWGTPASPG